MRRSAAAALAIVVAGAGQAQEVASAPGAVLRGLDKVAGATTDIEIVTGASARFGRLVVTLSDCRYPIDDPSSNAFAFLSIADAATGSMAFEGWMIASSPALSALDDPRYDIWVLRCTSS
ncbi:hypothetical protein DEA8626_01976 [Defluviimonas aquaemixtae]|uniref:DUF2155 domain-containing protein n=1 Tax=Albidovulum aquaemixtae TaxID=1542388 RepID=A0A2R8B719_9RHOB|nr:DUF2155 domain-containing protein [Defluviimonas aquaemixtae]SPH18438.1 hypothetical protein DEA8626_01976 [Defluviimonas aquaemixtae]